MWFQNARNVYREGPIEFGPNVAFLNCEFVIDISSDPHPGEKRLTRAILASASERAVNAVSQAVVCASAALFQSNTDANALLAQEDRIEVRIRSHGGEIIRHLPARVGGIVGQDQPTWANQRQQLL